MAVDCFVSPQYLSFENKKAHFCAWPSIVSCPLSICHLRTKKGKTMQKRRSSKRQHNNLYAERSLLLGRKNLSQPLKYEKDVLSINKTIPKSKSTKKFSSHKCNELTKIYKQKIHTTGEFPSVRSCKVNLERLPEMMRKMTVKFSKNNSENVQPSVSPEYKKQQDNLNEKTPCIPKKLRLRSSNTIKQLEGQNEVDHDTVINVNGFRNESPNETARSSKRSMRSQTQALNREPGFVQLSKPSASAEFKKQQSFLNEKTPCMPKNLRRKSSNKIKEHEGSKEPGIVQVSKLSASPEFKKQKNILNDKTPCVPKKLRCKSSDKMKELQEQNEVHHNTAINISGFINESPKETARSSRRSMRSQSQAFLSKKPGTVQLSKLSASPELKKQQNILNDKTPCVPKKKLRCKSSDKMKELQEQNEVHPNTRIKVSGFINESPNETARSSRRSMRSQSQTLSKEPGIVQLSVSPEFKKQQNILNDKTPCVPKKLRSKSSDKMKKLQEQNELYKTVINMSEFINESPNETSRSVRKRKSKRLQPQESLKNKSDNAQLSKHTMNSTMERRAKETPNGKSNKHAQKNTPSIRKIRCVQKSSEKLQNKVRPRSCINFPIDDLSLLHFTKRQAKSDGHKLPGKNTLKRKRFIFDAMKEADKEYEDDIYEEREFANFINMIPDTSDSELSYSMATPKLGFPLTPKIHSKTPPYKDCFSPTQYALSRKAAEECFYRSKKRKSKSEPEIPDAVPEKKKIEFDEILENACKVQKEVEKLNVAESDCEDNYFTDDEN